MYGTIKTFKFLKKSSIFYWCSDDEDEEEDMRASQVLEMQQAEMQPVEPPAPIPAVHRPMPTFSTIERQMSVPRQGNQLAPFLMVGNTRKP